MCKDKDQPQVVWKEYTEGNKALRGLISKIKELADTPVPVGYALAFATIAVLASKKPIVVHLTKNIAGKT